MSDYTFVHPRDPSETSSLHPSRPKFKEMDSQLTGPGLPAIDRTAVRPGIGTWTPLCIVGGTVAAVVLAIVHHVFDVHFNGRLVEGFWTQQNTTQVEILLASAFKIVFCFSVGVSLCQVVWHSMRRQPLPWASLSDIDHLVGEPSLMTLLRMNLLFQAPATLVITSIILASPLITIFAPSLTVRQASAATRSLAVPNVNLSTDGWFDDVILSGGSAYAGPSGTWDRVVLTGLTSDTPVGWTIPDGCAPECRYNFTYFAPAVRCSDIAANAIDDAAIDAQRIVSRTFQDPPAAYLRSYDTEPAGALVNGILNFTALGDLTPFAETNYTGSALIWTLVYVPFNAANSDGTTLINAAGTTCTFYNATHQAEAHFFNGTQESSVTVVEFLQPMDTTARNPIHLFNENGNNSLPVVGAPGVAYAPGFGGPIHFFAIADAVTDRLLGAITRDYHGLLDQFDAIGGLRVQETTLVLETNLFESPFGFNTSVPIFPGLNTTAGITNISQALTNLVANITLGFVHMGTGLTTVDAVVTSPGTVFAYNRKTLMATYIAALVCLVAVSVFGMYCLVDNGEPSSNSFSQLLIATRNARLDQVADAVEAEPSVGEKSRLMFGEVEVPGRGTRAAFGLVSEQKVEVLRRRR
ncbi:hypothetical protein B0H16DRAFT_1746837 [Mycena metata]|uniref:Uncharacterized protein n=1 Tax=Mycena metata TaxID=1033252 RepID=A0AAD7GWB1_9AGAR|nr:hypothetical protein B0H16DRAFT_1746837 [Mycena metata]